jgi:hypothetical protein
LPLYAAIAPGWDAKKVAALAERLDMHADVADAGPWYVCRNEAWTLEVYQASQSLRLEHNRFDFESRDKPTSMPDRDRAVLTAQRFLGQIGDLRQGEVASVTELVSARPRAICLMANATLWACKSTTATRWMAWRWWARAPRPK